MHIVGISGEVYAEQTRSGRKGVIEVSILIEFSASKRRNEVLEAIYAVGKIEL